MRFLGLVSKNGDKAKPRKSRIKCVVENTPWLNTLQLLFLAWMNIREILAANLKRYRHAAGLSQEELAHRAGIDRTYISSLERCQYAASIEVVEDLARELGIEAHVLIRAEEEKS